MANHDSALRQMRRSRKKRAINRANTAQLKTQVKKLRSAMEKGDAAAAKSALIQMATNCKGCHDAHREKLADGTYKIK